MLLEHSRLPGAGSYSNVTAKFQPPLHTVGAVGHGVSSASNRTLKPEADKGDAVA
jgi:hypothetical protein